MKVKSIVAASVLVMCAVAGQAQEYVAPDAGFVSTKTRAQVVAELEQAKADGTLNYVNSEYPQFVVVPSTVTREAVLRELREAQLKGMALTQRLDGVDTPAPVVSTKTRAEVIAELEAYKRQRPARDLYSGNTPGFGG